MSGINLKKRLLTASILIPIVLTAAYIPQTWFIINLGIFLFIYIDYRFSPYGPD